jgi:hypothetical protein
MRVLFVTTGSISSNGSIQRAIHLAKAGWPLGIESRILLMDTAQNRELAERFQVMDLVRWVQSRAPWHYLTWRHELAWCDVLHLIAPTLAGSTLGVLARFFGYMVVSDWDELYLYQKDGRIARLRRRLLHLAASGVTHAYVFASRALQSWYLSQNGKKPNSYIPYGLWPPASAATAVASPGGWVFYLGSYHRVFRSDLDELFTLARLLAPTPFGMMLAGSGQELPRIEAKLRQILPAHRLKICGFVRDVDETLLDPAIRLCFLPLEDNMQNRCRCPNKMFHYALGGKMILTNRVGEVAELMGDCVEYYHFGDEDSMRTALIQALAKRPSYDFESLSWARRGADYRQFIQKIRGSKTC